MDEFGLSAKARVELLFDEDNNIKKVQAIEIRTWKNPDGMLERLKSLICPILEDSDMSIDENTVILRDLNINSYDVVELVCDLEEEFDIRIPDKKIKTFVTVGDIIRYIEEKK